MQSPVTEPRRHADVLMEKGWKAEAQLASQESCGGTRVTPAQGADGWTWEPAGAGGMTDHSGDEGAWSQGGTEG